MRSRSNLDEQLRRDLDSISLGSRPGPNPFRVARAGLKMQAFPETKLVTGVFKFGFIAWLVWAGISLTFFGAVIAVAWHFIAKYW